jgi:hypothetical protein
VLLFMVCVFFLQTSQLVWFVNLYGSNDKHMENAEELGLSLTGLFFLERLQPRPPKKALKFRFRGRPEMFRGLILKEVSSGPPILSP